MFYLRVKVEIGSEEGLDWMDQQSSLAWHRGTVLDTSLLALPRERDAPIGDGAGHQDEDRRRGKERDAAIGDGGHQDEDRRTGEKQRRGRSECGDRKKSVA